MVGSNNRIKSLINQAQQKITDIQNNEKFKEVVEQAQKQVSSYQNIAQQKFNDIQNKAAKNKLECEKQQLEKATNKAAINDFKKAIFILEKIPSNSEIYTESQQKIIEYRDSFSVVLLQDATDKYTKGCFSEALVSLKLVPEGTKVYEQAQEKIVECEEARRQQIIEEQKEKERILLEKQKEKERILLERKRLIESFKNLVAINYKEKLVAAALVNNTLHLVDSVKRTKRISSALGSEIADGEFLIIRLLVRNDDKKSRTISASMINLIDHQEREFSASSSGSTALIMSGDKTAEILATEVQPGLQKNISIVFDLPPGATDLKLKIPSGLFGKPVILPLSLAL